MNDTLLMVVTKYCSVKTYGDSKTHLFNWILPFIKKMNDNDRLKLLTATNNIGNNVLHFAYNLINGFSVIVFISKHRLD